MIDATGVLAGKTRRALDSTVLDDAVTRQDTIMQLVAQIRRVRRLIPAAERLELVAHDYDNDAGKPACAWDDPTDIDRVVTELVERRADDPRPRSTVSSSTTSRPTRSACWRWSPAKTSNPATRDGTWRIARRTAPGTG